jgi:hypothetical protein
MSGPPLQQYLTGIRKIARSFRVQFSSMARSDDYESLDARILPRLGKRVAECSSRESGSLAKFGSSRPVAYSEASEPQARLNG